MNFEEAFVAKVISEHLAKQKNGKLPTITDAFAIYMHERLNPLIVLHLLNTQTITFVALRNFFGDLTLDELKHWHITEYRDYQLNRGLSPVSIRKHNNTLNAMLNVAFKHLDIDRLSPFRALKIRGEGETKRSMPIITTQLIKQVKEHLLKNSTPHKLISINSA
jgi:hypothetical protein